jgi:hypothetical protein
MVTGGITAGSATVAPVAFPTGDGAASPQAGAASGAPGREIQPGRGDRVTLQGKVREAKKAAPPEKRPDEYVSRMGSVLFFYNSKGDLRIRFMDSTNRLVYQTPPVMIARMEDIMRRADSSVSSSV